MSEFHVSIGETARFRKTVGETDVYMFAGITGDFAPNHVDKTYMERSSFGRLQAHGALLVGFMSTAAGIVAGRTRDCEEETAVSLGYDRIRFTAPVFLGDTITVDYRIVAIDTAQRRSTAEIEIRNQDGVLVSVGTHILAWVSNREP
ncbi:acyl dehydratase [Sphingomonas sp. BE270]|jgi:3-hydroxybutyryl-CoA dehydratase|uniref:MaoC/PaaZ C-terminal domain-containing protein n=1 Tax=Sphingomonas sp. BE270 TaxID=2817726 RepID=UPI002861BDC7|nr:MaoC/PaaZ C-terminal domain-containing protein [Sphingomonas sp. BE270]MDR7260279.1 acyl dehydratase [Sphingomonas sp. BE270]